MSARKATPLRRATGASLRGDRMIHMLTLCLAITCALWVLIDVQRLRATAETKENNLHDFLVLSQGITLSQSQDPLKTAARLGELLAGRSWEGTFATLKPKVVTSGSGSRLQLIQRSKTDEPGTGQDPRKIIRDGRSPRSMDPGKMNPGRADK